jgi:predicted esterase
VAYSYAEEAHAVLAKLGVPMEYHSYPGMRHEVGAAEIKDLSAWLAQKAGTGTTSMLK